MAKRIKGITIEIDGETRGLDRALQDVNKRSQDVNKELREVDRLLKFNPGNTELIAQKQKLLGDQVAATRDKLNRLKDAQAQVQRQFENGDIGAEQYRAFRREIVKTESQLEKFQRELASVDDGRDLENLQQDMRGVEKETDQAKSAIGDLGTALAGAAAAGVGAATAIDKALDFSTLDTQIDISFNVPEESKKSVKQAVKDVSAYGVDAEEALEGIRRQWALNAKASDESNAKVVKGAAAIAKAYAGIDFTELIQETNEISKALKISDSDALGLTNSLLKIGFPPEQLDIISEYGTQLKNAGYDAEEIQAIMAAGVETGTWNIDNLLDGLKEGRIRVSEFGQEVPKAVKGLLEGTNISAKQLQKWGQEVAKGGEGGAQAMQEIAKALNGVDNETQKNLLGVQIFGTMYEDQGQNIIDTLLNAENQTVSLKENTDGLNSSVQSLDSSPAVLMQQAFNDIQTALGPLLEKIAGFVANVASWASKNPELTATIVAVVSAIGILLGALTAITPIITALASLAGVLGVSIGAISAPVLIVIGVITALVAIFATLWANWDSISKFLVNSWNWIAQQSSQIFGSIASWFSSIWSSIGQTFNNAVSKIKEWVIGKFRDIVRGMQEKMNSAKSTISSIWNAIKSFFSNTVGQIWSNTVSKFTSLVSSIGSKMSAAKSKISSIWNSIKGFFSRIVGNIWSVVSSNFGRVVSTIGSKMGSAYSTVKTILGNIKSFFSGINLYKSGKAIIQSAIDGLMAMKDKILRKVNDIVGAVRDFWPFSPAKRGPLSDIDKMDFAGPIETSLKKAESPLIRSTDKLANDVLQSLSNMNAPVGINGELGTGLAEVNAAGDMSAVVQAIQQLSKAVLNQPVEVAVQSVQASLDVNGQRLAQTIEKDVTKAQQRRNFRDLRRYK
ncbi:phage tail tape measure protein [Bacillus paralicheniformis]|uniref:phage tail tape measure protein n=1 Tax=Bacillus paralicheniformis TaxID=1648923 RepID=UPI00068F2814|nr:MULTISPECIES: phage tail tape measure protein [Bacillus]AUZ29820.1 hypothetical protein C1T27_05535 [Bacillus licheniformis]MBZ5212981.1 phage tail tape measure protein [Bacillus paralicheniformis]MCY1630882.1 phage tail tape measure protein [Bacillus paralicheniformis]UAY70740.1 phage tail tape measure protein [Bacillus paralicheniformis]